MTRHVQAQQALFRSAQVFLLAVVVGAASAGAGFVVSAIGLVAGAFRARRIARHYRAERAARQLRASRTASWDTQWERWGGRLPQRH